MTREPQASWHPAHSWVDPLILLLLLLSLLAAGLTLRVRGQNAQRPAEHVGLQGRMMEVALAGPSLLGREATAKEWARAESQLTEPWDRALLTVLRAEQSARKPGQAPNPELRATPPGPAGERFRHTFLAAYSGEPLPDRVARDEVHRRLGRGYGADLLEARLRDREGRGEALRRQAQSALKIRLAGLGLLGFLVLTLAAGGLALGVYLMATLGKALPPPLPTWTLSGRAAAVVLLSWFLVFFLSGNAVGLVLAPWPALRWLAPALAYLLHASFGLLLICRAEGISLAGLWQRVAPGRAGRELAWGLAFLALAVLLVIIANLLSNLVLKPDQAPQRDLQDLVRGLSGWGPTLVLFLTVAVLAPFFEELLFRGFLLPVLARHQRISLALTGSALLFGAIHLQPTGLATLSTLGLVMGLAMRHTGSLQAPILVHACWNGSLFLLMRAFA